MSKYIAYFLNLLQEQFFQFLWNSIFVALGILIDQLFCRVNRRREFRDINAFVNVKLCTIRNSGKDLIIRPKDNLIIDTIISIYEMDKNGSREYIALGYIANTQENNVCTLRVVHKVKDLDINKKYLYSTRIYRTQPEILFLFNNKERNL